MYVAHLGTITPRLGAPTFCAWQRSSPYCFFILFSIWPPSSTATGTAFILYREPGSHPEDGLFSE